MLVSHKSPPQQHPLCSIYLTSTFPNQPKVTSFHVRISSLESNAHPILSFQIAATCAQRQTTLSRIRSIAPNHYRPLPLQLQRKATIPTYRKGLMCFATTSASTSQGTFVSLPSRFVTSLKTESPTAATTTLIWVASLHPFFGRLNRTEDGCLDAPRGRLGSNSARPSQSGGSRFSCAVHSGATRISDWHPSLMQ